MSFTAKDLQPLVRGDDWNLKLTLTSESNPVDITGYGYYFTLKENIDNIDADAALQISITAALPDSALGIVTISATNAETNNLIANKTYFYDIQQTDTGGNVQTLLIGKVKIVKDVTRTT